MYQKQSPDKTQRRHMHSFIPKIKTFIIEKISYIHVKTSCTVWKSRRLGANRLYRQQRRGFRNSEECQSFPMTVVRPDLAKRVAVCSCVGCRYHKPHFWFSSALQGSICPASCMCIHSPCSPWKRFHDLESFISHTVIQNCLVRHQECISESAWLIILSIQILNLFLGKSVKQMRLQLIISKI